MSAPDWAGALDGIADDLRIADAIIAEAERSPETYPSQREALRVAIAAIVRGDLPEGLMTLGRLAAALD